MTTEDLHNLKAAMDAATEWRKRAEKAEARVIDLEARVRELREALFETEIALCSLE